MSASEASPADVKALPQAYFAPALKDHRDLANAIRALSMDAIQKANSGHPGLPMGAADFATVLFTQFLKFDPADPHWPDRDRFVLSAGHGSMLLYALLYLTGYTDMTIEEIKRFRQLGSRTAGHPEFGHAGGIEATTGPLGQGFGNAVGMAIAERHLNARFGTDLVDHHTYVLVGDGCLMEGIGQEALSLAGHLKLNRLIVLHDDNHITIDGSTNLADSTDQVKRFEASGWSAVRVDGHDPQAVADAIRAAQKSDRPSFISCRTIIGFGAVAKQGTSAVHGSPLGAEEIAIARKALGWDAPPFIIPDAILARWRKAGTRSVAARADWEKRLAASDKKGEFERIMSGALPQDLAPALARYEAGLAQAPSAVATRNASQNALEVISPLVPEMMGGSADLTGSNNTRTKGQVTFTAENYAGSYFSYGIREHVMAAAMNGMACHGGLIPYGGTFLTFSDYCRNSIRVSALAQLRVIYVMTHDSIGLGEDGPTHQPVEHLASLRAMPGLLVFRPCDAVETAECWDLAVRAGKMPSLLALSRQKMKPARLKISSENLCARGAYEPDAGTEVTQGKDTVAVIFATGSEVEIAMATRDRMAAGNIFVRVVSVPSMELFRAQDGAYQARIMGKEKIRIAIEAGVRMGWDAFIGSDGHFIGMTGFGASAPAEELYKHFGITAEAAMEAIRARL